MSVKFTELQKAVNNQLNNMTNSGETLFEVDYNIDEMFDHYLKSFPEGTNPLHVERTEHDCQCCKNFMRDIGGVVTINEDDTLTSIWDTTVEGFYQEVVDSMSAYVKSKSVKDIYMPETQQVGVKFNYNAEGSIEYSHFYFKIPSSYMGTTSLKENKTMLKRAVEELSEDSINDVIDLIKDNNLLRGQEHRGALETFLDAKQQYSNNSTDNNLWKLSQSLGSVCRFRNTVIGSLIVDLSNGVDLQTAVTSFEKKVDPTNYKRSKAIVTPAMVKKSVQRITELGYADSLERRFAVENDIPLNDVLYADSSFQSTNKLTELLQDIENKIPAKNPLEMSVEDFIKDVLPTTTELSVYLGNNHENNLMSLVAPVNPDSKNMLKWDNNFSWSYQGEFTDSISQRVSKAGGNIVDDRVSLSWFNTDDLDLSVCSSKGGKVYFGDKTSNGYGELDVDMNAGEKTENPVENIFWKDWSKDAVYDVYVHNYDKCSSANVGFEIEMNICGVTELYSHEKDLPNNAKIKVATITVKNGKAVFSMEKCMKPSNVSNNIWGVDTNKFHKVRTMCLSPNYWEGNNTGNKHTFFILEGCKNPKEARGFYNEFLKEDLREDRKTFEMLSGKMLTPYSDNQLSGLGFSSTKDAEVLVRVKGSTNRDIKIKFN